MKRPEHPVFLMPRRNIRITEEAYFQLKALKTSDKESFSDVILRFYPERRKLSEIIEAIGPNRDLADEIKKGSREIRRARARKTGF